MYKRKYRLKKTLKVKKGRIADKKITSKKCAFVNNSIEKKTFLSTQFHSTYAPGTKTLTKWKVKRLQTKQRSMEKYMLRITKSDYKRITWMSRQTKVFEEYKHPIVKSQ